MALVEIVGYAAAAASCVAFSARTMIPLRMAAICSNVLFVTYGVLSGLWPAAVLHTVLLPLNVHRLSAMRKLIKRVDAAQAEPFDPALLHPYMRRKLFRSGHVIFSKGELAHSVYYLVAGRVRFPEIGAHTDCGVLFGEIGLFTPEQRRTLSCVCETDVEVLCMTNNELRELYFQNPEFGVQLVQLIVGRMKGQIDELERRLARGTAAAAPEAA
jgi:hypothetical protein